MIETRFHADLYSRAAVETAVKIYEPYAAITLSESEGAFVVRITASGGIDEAQLAGELGNYALGETIEKRGAATTTAGGAA